MRLSEVISLDPEFKATYGERGLAYYSSGIFRGARFMRDETRLLVESWCIAVIYEKLGRHGMGSRLSTLKAALGRYSGYQYAAIYAQWGNRARHWNGLRRRCGCVIRDWCMSRPTRSWTPCARSRASRRLSGS